MACAVDNPRKPLRKGAPRLTEPDKSLVRTVVDDSFFTGLQKQQRRCDRPGPSDNLPAGADALLTQW